MTSDEACCIAVGAHAERVRALDLEQVGQLLEAIGDLGVLDRHGCQAKGVRFARFARFWS